MASGRGCLILSAFRVVWILLIPFFLFFNINCQKKQIGSSINLELSGFATQGQSLVAGFHHSGKSHFVVNAQNQSDIPLSLTIGSWDFVVINWSLGDDKLFTGNIRCGHALDVKIAEPEESLEIPLSDEACGENLKTIKGELQFSDLNFSEVNAEGLANQWKRVRVVSCKENAKLASTLVDCALFNQGGTQSFRWGVRNQISNFDDIEQLGKSLSECQSLDGDHYKETDIRLPLEGAGQNFSFYRPVLLRYTSDDCSGIPEVIQFGKGISEYANSNDNIKIADLRDDYVTLFIDDYTPQSFAPVVDSYSAVGAVDIGLGKLTLRGNYLKRVTSVDIDGVDCAILSQDRLQIICELSAMSVASHNINITSLFGNQTVGTIEINEATFADHKLEHVEAMEWQLGSTYIPLESSGVSQVSSGQIIYAKTDEGRFGVVEIDSFDVLADDLFINLKVFNADGSVHVERDNLQVDSSFTVDLDAGTIGPNPTVDLWYNATDSFNSVLARQNDALTYALP